MAQDARKNEHQYVGDSRIVAEKKVNRPRPYSEYPGKTEPFFPNFLLKEWMAAVVVLIAFMVLVVSHPAPLEPTPANPNDSNYIPLPDWYFLFLYQLLKYFPGNLEIVGTVVIPGVAALLFLLVPWLDRKPERRPWKRPIPTFLMLFVVAGIVFLTYQAVVQHEEQVKASGLNPQAQAPQEGGQGAAGGTTEKAKFDPAAQFAQSCASCHGADLAGNPSIGAPKLTGLTLTPEEIANIAANGKGNMPPGMFTGPEEDRLALAKWILEHK
ncbi:MAG: c-type cytochrome [Thermicanus sp.]|nr:c-type cytochrome [Thermicanus sp.]